MRIKRCKVFSFHSNSARVTETLCIKASSGGYNFILHDSGKCFKKTICKKGSSTSHMYDQVSVARDRLEYDLPIAEQVKRKRQIE